MHIHLMGPFVLSDQNWKYAKNKQKNLHKQTMSVTILTHPGRVSQRWSHVNDITQILGLLHKISNNKHFFLSCYEIH